MSQPNTFARFCTACGAPLPGPVAHCPRCGAAIAAQARTSSNAAVVVVVVVVSVLVGISCLGILAAIAIPNFIRYQLRAKASETDILLAELVKAEEATLLRDGHFVPLAMPAGKPGRVKLALTPDELALASQLGWAAPAATYGQYRVEVGEDGRSASFCAEADVDGDGERSVHVAFLPSPAGEAPDAPCTEPVEYSEDHPPGTVVKVTPDRVF